MWISAPFERNAVALTASLFRHDQHLILINNTSLSLSQSVCVCVKMEKEEQKLEEQEGEETNPLVRNSKNMPTESDWVLDNETEAINGDKKFKENLVFHDNAAGSNTSILTSSFFNNI